LLKVSIQGQELAFRTTDRLFSPKAADGGTLAMLSLIAFKPDDKVLDLGCGYGLVGVLAARLLPPDQVFMLDNDPAAVEAARDNLTLNGVAGVQPMLSDGFQNFREIGFSKIISNPPYHVDFSVPKHFIEKGFNRLRVGGVMWMVTKRRNWYENKLRAIFGGTRVHEIDGYFIFEAEKRGSRYGGARDPA
jgi:16S rRNA (guanine1207-N2)-methyltransferase